MSDPIVDPSDLEIYMQMAVGTINTDRASMLLGDAQSLAETVVAPLPAGADQIIRRMAAAAYTNPSGAQVTAIGTARLQFGSGTSVTKLGVVLTPADSRDLRRLAGGSTGAFSFDPVPADALSCLPIWDVDFSVSPSELTIVRPIVSVSTSTIAAAFDDVLVDATSGPVTITIPPLAIGEVVTVQKIDSTNNVVTVVSSAGWLISGAASYHIAALLSVDFVPNGSALWAQ